jgi:hypothetical protein
MTTTPSRVCLLALLIEAAGCSGSDDGASVAGYTLLDDMEGAGSVIAWVPPVGESAGAWWTAIDCTQADRIEPPPPTVGANDWSFDLLLEPHETFPGITSQHAARMRTTTPIMGVWGATMGFDLLWSVFSDGAAPAPDPDAGCVQPTALGLTGGTVDLSAYSGLTFWAMAAPGGLRNLRVSVRDSTSDPRAGFCNAADPTNDADCYNAFSAGLTLTETFMRYTIDFSTLKQDPNWGVRSPSGALDAQHVYTINFTFDLCMADAGSMCAGGDNQPFTFDLRVDDIYLVNR